MKDYQETTIPISEIPRPFRRSRIIIEDVTGSLAFLNANPGKAICREFPTSQKANDYRAGLVSVTKRLKLEDKLLYRIRGKLLYITLKTE